MISELQGQNETKTVIGKITVGNIRFDLVDHNNIYIGRANKRYQLPASVLENPNPVTAEQKKIFEKYPELALKELAKYQDHLETEIAKQSEVYDHLIELRDSVLSGNSIRLLCWCKDRFGNGYCHGDIIKAKLEAMVEEELAREK